MPHRRRPHPQRAQPSPAPHKGAWQGVAPGARPWQRVGGEESLFISTLSRSPCRPLRSRLVCFFPAPSLRLICDGDAAFSSPPGTRRAQGKTHGRGAPRCNGRPARAPTCLMCIAAGPTQSAGGGCGWRGARAGSDRRKQTQQGRKGDGERAGAHRHSKLGGTCAPKFQKGRQKGRLSTSPPFDHLLQ